MYCLKSILTSPRIKVDADRQYRTWTGTVKNNNDLRAALTEILPIYRLEKASNESTMGTVDPNQLNFHYETHNFALSYNQPRFDVRPKLGDIAAPTLILVGRHDPVAPVEFSEEIHDMMQNSELTIFENSGHNPFAEEPEAFQQRVTKFLDDFRL
jgi:proline iminopeptidase